MGISYHILVGALTVLMFSWFFQCLQAVSRIISKIRPSGHSVNTVSKQNFRHHVRFLIKFCTLVGSAQEVTYMKIYFPVSINCRATAF
jgi:hypothetical protein